MDETKCRLYCSYPFLIVDGKRRVRVHQTGYIRHLCGHHTLRALHV